MLASFVAGGVVMPGVHRLHHVYLEVQSEAGTECDHALHDVAFEEDHVELIPDHCTLCTVATSHHLLESVPQSGILNGEYFSGIDLSFSGQESTLPLTIRGPPSSSLN